MNPVNADHPLLVATDFSAPSRQAAGRAARLAHETGAPMHLLHVMPGDAIDQLRQWLGMDSPPEHAMQAQAQRQLDEMAGALAEAHRVTVQSHCASGPVIDEILRRAQAVEAPLLVLGARGAGFMRRLILGTTAERLMRRSSRPLLVVRQKAHEPYRRVLVAVDFSAWSLPAVATARRVAPHAHLVLMPVFSVPFEDKLRYAGVEEATIEHYRQQARQRARDRLMALAERAGLKPGHWEPRVIEGEASMRLVEQEQELDCDLVVLGKHGQTVTEDLLPGSVTRHVLAEGSADVLISTAREETASPA